MSSVRVEESKYPDISITGRMGSGKTYTSNWLLKNVGYTRLSFATALKDIEMHLEMHSPLRTLIYMLRKYEKVSCRLWLKLFMILDTCRNMEIEQPKPRKRLQYLGNIIRQEISEDYWVNIALKKYRALKEDDPSIRVVFDDTRYPNEVACLEKAGFITIKLETFSDVRMNRLKREYGITEWEDGRLWADSENSCDDDKNKFDYVVINNDDNNAIEVFRDIIVNYITAQDFINNSASQELK